MYYKSTAYQNWCISKVLDFMMYTVRVKNGNSLTTFYKYPTSCTMYTFQWNGVANVPPYTQDKHLCLVLHLFSMNSSCSNILLKLHVVKTQYPINQQNL